MADDTNEELVKTVYLFWAFSKRCGPGSDAASLEGSVFHRLTLRGYRQQSEYNDAL